MASSPVIVLIVDRLGADWLGPYGSTWFETPHWNALAAQSALAEWMIASGPKLEDAYEGWWGGARTWQRSQRASLPERIVARGQRAILLTDDSAVADLPQVAAFTEAQLLKLPEPTALAEASESTQLLTFFQAAADLIGEGPDAGLIWLHTRGLAGAWDAPYALRQQWADEDDPLPPDTVAPPERHLPADYDPDELLGYLLAYGGQLALLDQGLGLLLEAVDQAGYASQALCIVTSPRGYPLGEHGCVGLCHVSLYEELLHVPFFVRFPGRTHALTRLNTLLQPADLWSLLVCHGGWMISDETPPPCLILDELERVEGRPVAACARGPGQRAIRTPAWFLREVQQEEGPRRELFVKPDDRWEVNEVSSRCHEVVEELLRTLDAWQSLAQTGQSVHSLQIPPVLWDVWR
jgi:hypothetical protein